MPLLPLLLLAQNMEQHNTESNEETVLHEDNFKLQAPFPRIYKFIDHTTVIENTATVI